MNILKSNLIEAYRFITSPYRTFRFARMKSSGKVPPIILFYHRIADETLNPWTLSRNDFEQQIDWFQEQFDIVSLEECQNRIASGHNTRPTLSITFDDGYAENCDFALPLLIERNIPVTYFVTTRHPVEQTPFAHDVERSDPLPVNTVESLRALSAAGVEIGAHTRSHADLGKITCPTRLIDEVVSATLELENLIDQKISYFAFPYGQYENLNRDAFALLKQIGIRGVCSAYGGWNDIGADPFHLQRIHGDPCMSRIKNWLSFDPRIAKTERFDHKGGKVNEELLTKALAEPPVSESSQNQTTECQATGSQTEFNESEIDDSEFSDTIALEYRSDSQ